MPDHPGKNGSGGRRGNSGLSRRDFLKRTSAAVSAGVLVTEDLLRAQQPPAGRVVGPGAVPITLRINGQERKLTVEPRVTLLDALRDYLDLTGAKKVCDRGTCGACTVHLDGRAIYACTMLAIDAARGQQITTIEGLAAQDELHPVSAAFVEHDAQQCGFCTPGFVMAAVAYLQQNSNPTYEQVAHSLHGNLCRCGTYMGVRRAVVDAALKLKGGRG
jgi:aerobic-type carbon monoxide dehydrogenase small subunit (CoxS/CutS family)